MSVRHNIELSALEHEVGMDKTDEGAAKRDESAQERRIRERFAEHRGDDSACREAEQKRRMCLDLAAQSMVFRMPDELREIRADLADMVRYECRGGRHAFHLAIRIELHRANEVQRHLADLVRPRSRHEGKKDDSTHLECDEERVPAQEVHALDGLAHPFREEGAEEIGTDRKQKIGCREPLLPAKRHREEDDICRLCIAEDATTQKERVGAIPACHKDQKPERISAFALEISCLHTASSSQGTQDHLQSTLRVSRPAKRICNGFDAAPPRLRQITKIL